MDHRELLTPDPFMADPVFAPASEPPVYRPVAGLAIFGFGLGCVSALIVLIGAVISFFRGTPLLLPDWVLAAPVAGAILSFIGARQIRNSEGTRAGLKLTQYGLWLSVVCGLTYFVYVQTIVWAVTQQANHFLVTQTDEDSGFLPRLQAAKKDPKELNRAFLLGLPPVNRAAADPDDERAMRKQHEELLADGSPGLLYRFRNFKFVAAVVFAGDKARVEPLAVLDWKFADGSYRVSRAYRVTTAEGTREYLLRAQSVEGIEPGERRKWIVFPQSAVEMVPAKLTPLGEKIDAYRRSAYAFLQKWASYELIKGGLDFKAKDVTRWEELMLDDAARTHVRDYLTRQLPKGGPPVQVKKEDEEFIPWEKVDGKIRLTLGVSLKLEPASQNAPRFIADMRFVLQTNDEAVVSERNWEIAQVYVVYAAPAPSKEPKR